MESLTEAATLIGRSGIVREIVHCLRDEGRTGALIVGSAGSGKTVVVKAVLAELRPQGRVIRLGATPALAAVPFGALAPYLAGLPSHDLDSYPAVLGAVTASLRSEPALALFVIDDAQHLDQGTIQLVAQSVATGAARLLASCRPGPLVPEEFLALWGDGIISKFDLPALSRAEVHQLCEQMLQADVSPWVSELFAQLTEGSPSMLTSLVEHARATGAIGQRHGTWFLLARPDLGDIPAADLVDHQVRSMPPEERTAAAIVALAGPLSLGQLLRFSSPRAVDALEMAGIIRISRDHDRIVSPASPVIGEIIRTRVPAGRSASLRSSLQSLPRVGAVVPDAVQNQLRWALDAGTDPADAELLDAASAANIRLDAATALRAAGAIREERRPETGVQLAYAHYILGADEDAAADLLAAQPFPYGRAAYLGALLAHRLGALVPEIDIQPQPVAGSAGTGTAPPEAAVAGAAPPGEAGAAETGAGAGQPQQPGWAAPATGLACAVLAEEWSGRPAELAGRLHELIAAAAGNPEIRVPAQSRLAALQTAQGFTLAALSLHREAWRGVRDDGVVLPLVYEDVLGRHCLCLIRAGEWEELATVLDDYSAGLPSRLLNSGGLLHVMRGYSRLRQGRITECLAELQFGVEELLISDPWELLGFARAITAYAAAAVGRTEEAAEQAEAYRQTDYREPETLRLLAEAYCAAAESAARSAVPAATGVATGAGIHLVAGAAAAGDDGGEVGPELARLAAEAQRQGLRAVETDIRRIAVRGGNTGAAEALAASSGAVEGAEARALHAYALAVAASDSTELTALSDRAMAAGHLLLALEAAQQAARLLENDPEKWKLTAVQRKVHQRMLATGMSGLLTIIHGEHHSELTARESEILKLVAGGASNAEIAEQLTVSQRTVEGHLYRIFGKLGVSRRGELVDMQKDLQPP